MRPFLIGLVAGASALATPLAWSQATTLASAGFTGLGITPNAHLIGWGRLDASYERQVPGLVQDPAGHNFVAGFGLLPNLEIAGRLATNTLDRNCFVEPCGTRDLSASAKVGIGLDAGHRFRIAAGVTDVGGAATLFRTVYGVLTYDEGPLQASAGLARRSRGRPELSEAPLHGLFAAAAWQPAPWLRGHLEYAGGDAWAGARLFAPPHWLPEGWAGHVGVNMRLTESTVTRRAWLTAGISIPLYKVPDLAGSGRKAPTPAPGAGGLAQPTYEARTLPPAGPATPPPPPAAPARVPDAGAASAPADADLRQVAAALRAAGLEDISVGRMHDGSVAVRAENASYHWNSADALGAALGAVARALGDRRAGYRLILTQRQMPLVAVTGQTDCLRQWIDSPEPGCAGGQLSTPGTGALEPLHAGAQWVVSREQPSWRTLRIALSPVLRTNVGTEAGALDYSAGVNVGVRLPLWAGGSIEWRRDAPVANTSDYGPAGVFGARRIRPETERFALVHTMRVPLERWLAPQDDVRALRWGLAGVTGQATVGRIGSGFDGLHGALRWEPGEGRHRVTGEIGYFDNSRFGAGTSISGPRRAKPALASYRYVVTATRSHLEATAGQFMFNDRGFQLGLRQWFSDVSVNAYYRRSGFEGQAARQFIGIEMSLPIGPRRDMAPRGHVQVTGTPRFTHGVETLVRDANNAVRPGFGLLPPTPRLDDTFNSDRAGLVYFEDNIRRIRDAAR